MLVVRMVPLVVLFFAVAVFGSSGAVGAVAAAFASVAITICFCCYWW